MLVHVFRASTALIAVAAALPADNGALAHAFPISGVRIDGRLDDWPKALKRYAIRRGTNGHELVSKADWEASFRVAYCLETRSLLVALEVVDEQHVSSDDPSLRWNRLDGHVLYVDPVHSRRGSGARLFAALGKQRRILGADGAWDPSVAKAKLGDCEVVVRRDGQTTVYEWRVRLGDRLRPGRSFGLDHLVCDCDDESESKLYHWGPGRGKSRGASRCGDVLLVDTAEKLKRVVGTVGWTDPSDRKFPRRVRVRSLSDDDLWVHVDADERGRFELLLPDGEYEVSSPFKSFGRGNWKLDSLDPNARVRFDVRGQGPVEVKKLCLRKAPSLDALYEARGLLWREANSRADHAENARAIDAFVRAAMSYYHVPGASLAIVRSGRVVHHATYGYANYYTREPVTKETLFEACSITKIVFAFAVNRLVERGVIELDKPIHEYLPLEELAQDPRYRKITVRHCLSHQSGLPNWRRYNADGKIDIKFEPGTRFWYSGEAFEWLGRAVARVCDKPLERVLRDEVLEPLGFGKRVFFADSPALSKVVAHGHWTTRTAARSTPSSIGVAHSMHCDALEMANFMTAMMAGKGLSAAAYDRMWKPQRQTQREKSYPGPSWKRGYALGFEVMNGPYGRVYAHGGSNGDFKCRFEAYRDHDIGFVVFTNGSEGEYLYEALRRFLILGKADR